jgi:hypothetical protein
MANPIVPYFNRFVNRSGCTSQILVRRCGNAWEAGPLKLMETLRLGGQIEIET